MIRILFYGKVQGVGFRPQICKIAREIGIFGFVRNLGDCVEVVVQNDERLDEFLDLFYKTLPKEANITQKVIMAIDEGACYDGFEILDSQMHFSSNLKMSLPQDLKICDQCIEDMQKNPRFMDYAFSTCTDCGARYSIMEVLPYDRSNTTMKNHPMCAKCKEDYKNQDSRRFHAEPISCNECAIRLSYENSCGEKYGNDEAFRACVRDLREDKIIAFKGVGGFGLICKADAKNIARLRSLKKRDRKPFALMVRDIKRALRYVELSDLEKEVLQSKFAPILLAKKSKFVSKEVAKIEEALAPDLARLGIILPYSALHLLLLEAIDFDIVFTSANFSSEPIITNEAEMREYLGVLCDGLFGYDREIYNGIDDSLVQVMGDGKREWVQILRLARGYAPLHLCFDHLDNTNRLYMAKGAQERVNLAYRYNENIIITPYIGDLIHPKILNKYEDMDRKFFKFYQLEGIKQKAAITDLHPRYYSTSLAQKEGYEQYRIGHHKAHFASIFADSILQDKNLDRQRNALGIIWDGSGLGEDGKIWGGEFFYGNPLNDLNGIERIGHFKNIRIYGGENAAKESYKLAFSLSLEEGFSFVEKRLLERYPELEFLKKVGKMGFESSSCGRLFDIVACLCGLCDRQDYKAEGAMMMERYFDEALVFNPYGFVVENGIINLSSMWKEMLEDLFVDSHMKDLRDDLNAFYFVNDEKRQRVVSRFIHTLSAVIEYFIIQKYDSEHGLYVMFSGGVFNNANLCDYTIRYLSQNYNMDKLRLYFHHFVPCGDEGISLGQAMVQKV